MVNAHTLDDDHEDEDGTRTEQSGKDTRHLRKKGAEF